MKKLIVLAASLAAMRVAAQPTVVAVPLELEPHAELQKGALKLRAVVATTVEADSGALVALRRETEAALTETKRQDFRESDEALAQLAVKAKSFYALHTWADITTKRVMVLHGRVVRDDGKLMGSAEVEKPLKKEKPEVLVKLLTKELLAKLNIGALPAQKEVVQPVPVETPPVEVKKDPPVDFVPPPPPPMVELRDEGAGQRAVGQGLFATGLAVGAVGGIVAAIGSAIGGSVEPQNGAVTESQLSAVTTGRGLTTAGFVGIGVGAAAAIVGAIVWGTAPAAPAKTTVSVSPVAGGATLQVGGVF